MKYKVIHMLTFKTKRDKQKQKEWIETSLKGKTLLTIPQLNKGTAFTEEERVIFGLKGKLPARIETLEEQVERCYQQFSAYSSNLQKNIYLNNLNDKNQVLFYKLVQTHLEEMLPTIYTPIVGTAVKQFSQEFRQPRGLYISYDDIDEIDSILSNRTNPEIDLIVVTDGEGVLGIGDQGVGGVDIPVAKLMIYTLLGGIDPTRTLPIQLDVGTNNPQLLDDPYYLGLRHKRVPRADYDVFIEKFVTAVKKHFPNTFLHWEDLGRDNAWRILQRYQNKLCTFNDDIQGTGIVTMAALLAAVKSKNETLAEQRIVIFGGGTAGMGVADQVRAGMRREGLEDKTACERFWILDRPGLLYHGCGDLTPAQKPYARAESEIENWTQTEKGIDLLTVIKEIKPTILIGSSTVTGAFTQEVIETMAQYTSRPIIFPLSNPTERAEATPEDIINWTQANAMIATGSPFEPVEYHNATYPIAQSNNALAFPGLGLGIIAAKANQLTDNMLWAACEALSECAPILTDSTAPPLPQLNAAKSAALAIAIAVAKQARTDGVAQANADLTEAELIDEIQWEPHYAPYILK